MNPSLRHALLLLSVLALPACSWLTTKDNTPEPVSAPRFDATVELGTVLDFGVDDAGYGLFRPLWLDGMVWAVGTDGKLKGRSAQGERREAAFGADLSAGLDGNADLLVAATRSGRVVAVARDGKPLWQRDTGAEILSRPRVAGDMVFVRAQDGRLIALAAATGEIRWQSDVNNPALVLHVASGMTFDDEVVYAGFPGGRLRAYARANGKLLWENWVAQPRGATELERVADVVGDPWLDGKQVCGVAFQGRVACFNAENGEPLWARDVSSSSGLAGDHRHVYVTDATGTVIAYDRTSGSQAWKQDKLYARRVTAPVVLGRYVAVADYQGKVYLLDADNGNFAAMEDIGDAVRATPVVAGENLLVQDEDGDVSLLQIAPPRK